MDSSSQLPAEEPTQHTNSVSTSTKSSATKSTASSRPKSSSSPTRRGPARQLSSMQIVFGSIMAISLLLAINFSSRIAAGRRIETEVGYLQSTINAMQMQSTALASELNYVQSDSYVEQWAHTEGMMVRPDEVLIITVPGRQDPQPSPTPFVRPATGTAGVSGMPNWHLWWQLFFDEPPPNLGQ